ncbi:MAG TPA: hypothetical protein VHS80_14515 [Chthoniobacterales bacterium]|nr:hypothetical protein [Chthoniobacterales bacterium]
MKVAQHFSAELGPGWRLGGTLGIEFSPLTALKERKKTSELATLLIPEYHTAFYDSAFELILSLFQSYALFVAGTQGSAKPSPWAEFCNRFEANPTGCWVTFTMSRNFGNPL